MWEVVHPTSRAVELGEEDQEEETSIFDRHLPSHPVVRLSKRFHTAEKTRTISCDLLVLAFGRIGTKFIEAHFLDLDSHVVGLVAGGKKEDDLNSLLQTSSSDKTCFIHELTETERSGWADVLFCQSKVEYPAECCHNWAKEVFASIKAKSVVILSTQPASYCSLDETVADCIFALRSNSWTSPTKFPFLRSPNIVSDLPAAVLTHCQIFNIPAVMYVGLTESGVEDMRTINMFLPLLDEEPLAHVPKKSRSDALKLIKSMKMTSSHLDSNLYT